MSQQRLLATYLSPLVALGGGSSWDLRVCLQAPPPAASENLEIWRSGDLEIWKFGDLGSWKSGNSQSKQIGKIKILKIKIRVAQNVDNVWNSRKNPPDIFFMRLRALAAVHPWWACMYSVKANSITLTFNFSYGSKASPYTCCPTKG